MSASWPNGRATALRRAAAGDRTAPRKCLTGNGFSRHRNLAQISAMLRHARHKLGGAAPSRRRLCRRVRGGRRPLPLISSYHSCASPHRTIPFFWRRLGAGCFEFFTPDRGACGAPVALGCVRGTRLGASYAFTTHVNALLTDAQTPLSIDTGRHDRLAFIAHPGRARPAIDFRKPGKPGFFSQNGQARRACGEASCVPSDGTLAFRRSTWDFWPGPVLAVVRRSLQDRAATSFDARVIVTRRSRSREPPRRSR
jgi:hypothetical protein